MKSFSFLKGIMIVAIGLLCGIGAVIGYRAVVAGVKATITPAADAVNASSSGPATGSASAGSFGAPKALVIPSINVDAPVMAVGVAADGELAVPPDAVHVAWYEGGPAPGGAGAAVIDGHLDTAHSPEAVFYNLGNLTAGDEIDVVTSSGDTLVFRVTGTETLPYDAPATAVFASTSSVPELNLITCAGDWVPSKKVYNERLVVFSELVGTSTAPTSS